MIRIAEPHHILLWYQFLNTLSATEPVQEITENEGSYIHPGGGYSVVSVLGAQG